MDQFDDNTTDARQEELGPPSPLTASSPDHDHSNEETGSSLSVESRPLVTVEGGHSDLGDTPEPSPSSYLFEEDRPGTAPLGRHFEDVDTAEGPSPASQQSTIPESVETENSVSTKTESNSTTKVEDNETELNENGNQSREEENSSKPPNSFRHSYAVEALLELGQEKNPSSSLSGSDACAKLKVIFHPQARGHLWETAMFSYFPPSSGVVRSHRKDSLKGKKNPDIPSVAPLSSEDIYSNDSPFNSSPPHTPNSSNSASPKSLESDCFQHKPVKTSSLPSWQTGPARGNVSSILNPAMLPHSNVPCHGSPSPYPRLFWPPSSPVLPLYSLDGSPPYLVVQQPLPGTFAQGNTAAEKADKRDPDRPHRCSHRGCDKAYKRSSHLTLHMRKHTGEKPFVCRWNDKMGCQWRFHSNDERRRHERTHTKEKPFRCEHCGKSYPRSDHLTHHKKKQH